MKNRLFRLGSLAFVALIIVSSCLIEADAQTRRRRSRRSSRPVVVNPEIKPASEDQNTGAEAKIISTADDPTTDPQQPAEETQTRKSTLRKAPLSEQEQMERTINSLSHQVERLSDKLNQMQENDKTLLEMERLTRAEQRSESLRTQLVDLESKLADLQSKLEQIEYSLKPENIERAAAGFGSVRPEEARDSRRRQLENEKNRTQAQVRILETSRTRLEASLVTADAEVDRLRRRLELRDQLESDPPKEDERRTRDPEKPE